ASDFSGTLAYDVLELVDYEDASGAPAARAEEHAPATPAYYWAAERGDAAPVSHVPRRGESLHVHHYANVPIVPARLRALAADVNARTPDVSPLQSEGRAVVSVG